MSDAKLKDLETHFAFGQNWASYAALIDEAKVAEAEAGLSRLIPEKDVKDKSFLDIGCGSGLHALAASRLGASRMLLIDIDPDCIATARAVLAKNRLSTPCAFETMSVFDLDRSRHGNFDIVYSWGVLHHTGSMWEALDKAAAMVGSKGLLVLALYRPTRLDTLWKIEKRLYAHAPRFMQRIVHAAYIAAFRLAMFGTGRSFSQNLAEYRSRGMEFGHDVHDWLGGFPYESASAADVEDRLKNLGFKAERVFTRSGGLGIFGSGCDEYVYRRQ